MYPDNALSAAQLAIMAVVVVVSLAVWLTLVMLAARDPRRRAAGAWPRADDAAVTRLPSGATPSDATPSEAGPSEAGPSDEAAA